MPGTKTFRFAAFIAVASCICLSGNARAVTINIGSTTDNTVTTLTGGGSGDRAQGRSLVTTLAGQFTPDAINAMVNASTRFASTVAADRGSSTSGGTAVAQNAVNYAISFSVTPDFAASLYKIDISTLIFGAASARDDHSGVGSSGVASMTNVSGFLDNNPNAGLNLVSAATRNGTNNTSGQDTQFSANNLLSLGPFSGPQNFTLRFTMTMRAESPQNFIGGDEQAVRMGISDPLAGSSPDNYPGNPARVLANDGHFVSIKATILEVPEPSTYALAAMSFVSLGAVALRRRRSNA
jgi:hypothetical protein